MHADFDSRHPMVLSYSYSFVEYVNLHLRAYNFVATTSDTVASLSCNKVEQLVVDFEGHEVLTLTAFELELKARIKVVIASAYAGNASKKGWKNIVWSKFALVSKYRFKLVLHLLVCVL